MMLNVVYYEMDTFEIVTRYIWGVFLNGLMMTSIEREKKWQEVLLWILCFGSWALWLMYFIMFIVQYCRDWRVDRMRGKKIDEYFGITDAINKEKMRGKKLDEHFGVTKAVKEEEEREKKNKKKRKLKKGKETKSVGSVKNKEKK